MTHNYTKRRVRKEKRTPDNVFFAWTFGLSVHRKRRSTIMGVLDQVAYQVQWMVGMRKKLATNICFFLRLRETFTVVRSP